MNRMKRLIIAENNIRVTREVELEECARIFEGAVKRWANEMYVIVRGMSNNLMEPINPLDPKVYHDPPYVQPS